jgi:hypothetical protein
VTLFEKLEHCAITAADIVHRYARARRDVFFEVFEEKRLAGIAVPVNAARRSAMLGQLGCIVSFDVAE